MAHAEGYAAAAINPARLGARFTPSFAMGYQAQHFRLQAGGLAAETSGSPASLDPLPDGLSDATQAAWLGLSLPLQLGGILRQRLAFGLAVSTPGSTIVRVRILSTRRPQFPLLGSRSETLNFNVGLGLRLSDALYLGVGSALLADLEGEILIDAGASGKVTSVTDDELRIVQAPVFGLSWQATPNFALGAVWRGALLSEFALNVEIADLGQVVVPPLNITGLAQADPAQLQIETTFTLNSWLFTLGVSFKRWSEFKRFKEATVRCPPDQPDCTAPPAAGIDFANAVVPRVAGSYELKLTETSSGSIRLGYFLEPSPLAKPDPESRVFDNDRHVLSAGYGLEHRGEVPFAINLAAQWHILADREFELTQPSGRPFRATTTGSVWTYALDMEVPF